jgi:hypothetical protein
MEEEETRDVLLIHFQVYVFDLFKRATDEFGVPSAFVDRLKQ